MLVCVWACVCWCRAELTSPPSCLCPRPPWVRRDPGGRGGSTLPLSLFFCCNVHFPWVLKLTLLSLLLCVVIRWALLPLCNYNFLFEFSEQLTSLCWRLFIPRTLNVFTSSSKLALDSDPPNYFINRLCYHSLFFGLIGCFCL